MVPSPPSIGAFTSDAVVLQFNGAYTKHVYCILQNEEGFYDGVGSCDYGSGSGYDGGCGYDSGSGYDQCLFFSKTLGNSRKH